MQQKALYKLFFFLLFSFFFFPFSFLVPLFLFLLYEILCKGRPLFGLQFGASHLLCLLPLNNVDIKPHAPAHPQLSVLILNLEFFFLPRLLHVNAFSISVIVYFV